jgi:hypothetical protein
MVLVNVLASEKVNGVLAYARYYGSKSRRHVMYCVGFAGESGDLADKETHAVKCERHHAHLHDMNLSVTRSPP